MFLDWNGLVDYFHDDVRFFSQISMRRLLPDDVLREAELRGSFLRA